MRRVVRPGCSAKRAAVKIVEAVAMEEGTIHEDSAAEPAESPAPSAPAAASREVESEINSQSPTPAEADARIIQARPRICRRTPKIGGVIGRHINHLRIGGLNFDGGLPVLILRDHLRLRSICELARIL